MVGRLTDIFLNLLSWPFLLVMPFLGIMLCFGSLESLRRYFLPAHKRHRSLFLFIGLITTTIAGAFFAIASTMLLLNP
jgi:hypothetical protein